MPAAREGTKSAAKAFDRWFGTPKLVRNACTMLRAYAPALTCSFGSLMGP